MIKQLKFGLAALAATAAISYAGCKKDTDELHVDNVYDVTNHNIRETDFNRHSAVYIVDTSGSMDENLNGERKIDLAKKSLHEIIDGYNVYDSQHHNLEIGIIKLNGDIATVERVMQLQPFDYNALSFAIDNLEASGGTPLGKALAYAERELDQYATGKRDLVLLTDGANTDGRDPSGVWQSIVTENNGSGDYPTRLSVIAFDTSKRNFAGLEAQGVKVYEAKDGAELQRVLLKNQKTLLAEDPNQ